MFLILVCAFAFFYCFKNNTSLMARMVVVLTTLQLMVCSVLEARHTCMKYALQHYLIKETLDGARDVSDMSSVSSAFYDSKIIGFF